MAAREASGQGERARAESAASSSLWAQPPSLEVTQRSDRWSGDAGRRESEVTLAWPLWMPGQRDARGAAAQAALSAADSATAAARLKLAGEVREGAWSLLAKRAELAQAEEQARVLAALADDVERRVRAGDLARADALAARAEWLGAKAAESAARQQWRAAAESWRALTGSDGIAAAEEPPVPPSLDWVSSHPELLAASQASEQARRRLDVALASRAEAPELKLGWRHDEAARGDPAQKTVLIGVRVPFGTVDRNAPLVASAATERDIAQAGERRDRLRLDAEVASARAAVEAADAQVSAERERAALLRERASLVDKSFRAGESALPDLLRALSTAAQAAASRARQEAELGLARARLRQALGLLP